MIAFPMLFSLTSAVSGMEKLDHEFHYSVAGSSWTRTDVGSGSMSMHSICVGDVYGSGNRVYATNSDGYIYEFNCIAGTWLSPNKINNTMPILNPTKIVLGEGRNDGIPRLYVVSGGKIYEFSYNGGWGNPESVVNEPSTINDIKIGKGRNDGMNRIYAGTSDGHIYEYRYDNNWNNWMKEPDVGFIGEGSTIINSIAIGTPRDDNMSRIYAGTGILDGNGRVYEFTYGEGYGPKEDLSNVYGYPTPFFPKDGQSITFANVPPDAKIMIYTINGILVKKLIADPYKGAGWKGENEDGECVSSGTYVVCVTKGENEKIFKIMVIK